MSWKPWAYALLCVVAPAVWGLLVYRASDWIERRVLRKAGPASGTKPDDEETLPLEYYI